MRKLLIVILTCILLLCITAPLSAAVKVKVKGTIESKRKRPKTEVKNMAIENAKEQALKKYISGLDSQRIQILNDLMPELLADLDTYIIEYTNLTDGEYKNGNWEICLEVSINNAQIEQLVNSKMKEQLSDIGDIYISFVYVAREVSSVEKFNSTISRENTFNKTHTGTQVINSDTDTQTTTTGKINVDVDETKNSVTKTNTKTDTDVSNVTNQKIISLEEENSVAITDGGASTNLTLAENESVSTTDSNTKVNEDKTVKEKGVTNTNTVTNINGKENTNTVTTTNADINETSNLSSSSKTSGSNLMKSEELLYRGYNPAEIDTKVTEVFNKASFQVVPAYEVNITPEQFASDFASLGQISSSTQKEATDIARDSGLDFLAIGMLDVGREQIDPATGQYKIYVKVNGYIMDLRKRFILKTCSVGPVQYSGFGENPTVAKTNALIEASTKASKDLVDQLRVKLSSD